MIQTQVSKAHDEVNMD